MSSLTQRSTDMSRLHPVFREKAQAVLDRLNAEGIPFRIFEGYRSPQRQQFLYSQGRTAPGDIVTNAKPWSSYHQYGLAADFVLFIDGKWSWDTSGPRAACWDKLHAIGREVGLEPLSWEKPHLQLCGISIDDLRSGRYPDGGDDSWAEAMEEAISTWSGEPAAPPVPDVLPQRPPLSDLELPLQFQSRFGGREWCTTPEGVLIRENGKTQLLRTAGEPITCTRIWELYGTIIREVSARHNVPAALIMMTIATETGFARQQNFTGPVTFRWEPGVRVTDLGEPRYGDYSAGPMQTLASTARAIIRMKGLPLDPFAVAPPYERRPEPPATHPMYDPAISIELGAAVIRDVWDQHNGDPILAAACYNAGGIKESTSNPWRLRCAGDHLDRAARWYGDACAVLAKVYGSPS
jgi:Soluble lytic murein transglycosylase and related regulatory proteins (some contain LysM/invasin domains)